MRIPTLKFSAHANIYRYEKLLGIYYPRSFFLYQTSCRYVALLMNGKYIFLTESITYVTYCKNANSCEDSVFVCCIKYSYLLGYKHSYQQIRNLEVDNHGGIFSK